MNSANICNQSRLSTYLTDSTEVTASSLTRLLLSKLEDRSTRLYHHVRQQIPLHSLPAKAITAPPPAYNDTPRGQGSPSQAPPHSSQLGAEQPLHPPTSTSSPPTGNNITGSSGTIPTISTQPMNPTAQQQPHPPLPQPPLPQPPLPQPPLPQPPLHPQPQPQYTMQPQMATTGLSNQVDMQSLPQSGPWTPSGTMPQANGGAPQQQQSIAAQYQDELYARCARGDHDVVKKYGLFGIIIAIVCCPCGLLALLFDNEERCARCGIRISGSTI
ncbi:hypothetical protein C8Q75DRAFT_147985 [Abortiporus biennis]|nr:hypothetical protein C8Q75DRAFT_147985 [Abortiporus biennis]